MHRARSRPVKGEALLCFGRTKESGNSARDAAGKYALSPAVACSWHARLVAFHCQLLHC